jgi:excinuclease ABC subunit A
MQDYIEIEGARENNLQNISLRIPRHTLTVITGVSGSGKSSLAFDTLYKEGQRRFIESLSPYARQFLGNMEKPKVERIDGISPTVCIDQKRRGASSRSTVGTITAIYDYLRLLFARLGTPHCPNCHVAVAKQSTDQIARLALSRYAEKEMLILAPMIVERKGEYRKELAQWRADGFVRVRADGEIHRLDEKTEIKLSRYEKHTLELVLDRLVIAQPALSRLREDIEHATKIGNGLVAFAGDDNAYDIFSVHRACPHCGFSIPELEPRLFSFNSPEGACPTCNGSGSYEEFDARFLVPDPTLSLNEGALQCFNKEGELLFSHRYGMSDIVELAEASGLSLDTPWQELPPDFQQTLLYGNSEGKDQPRARYFPGVIPVLQQIFEKWHLYQLRRFLNVYPCTDCQGTRLRSESRHVLFHDHNIAQVSAMRVSELLAFLRGVALSPQEETIGSEIFHELTTRLMFLHHLGLAYLTLERHGNTLAGGEMQRIRLARQLGAGLQGVLYILDEPSIGLHARDNKQLLLSLQELRDLGNTVLVIEHDEETMRAADHLVDMGPGAGQEGGRVVAEGTLAQIAYVRESLTAQYLTGVQEIASPVARRVPDSEWLTIVGAAAHNLKNIDVAIPLGLFVAVTGVSGSGKSSLLDDVLYRAVARHLYGSSEVPGPHKKLLGVELIKRVVEVDQSPIGRTPRSNPATYTKIFDDIRELFSMLPEARARGYQVGRFSFNVSEGRCQMCEGLGYKEIEMQFLPSVWIPCEECNGLRFNRETLEIHYRNKNIADVLEMTVNEAALFFENHPKLKPALSVMLAVGLGYIRLGQPSPNLSGGEAQRIKIVRELQSRVSRKTLYILDEPTTGLHVADIKNLLAALQQLVDQGNTVLVIEHNMDVIKVADWIIDLGPEGGAEGGEVVVAGPPESVMACARSHTGTALREYFAMKMLTLEQRTTATSRPCVKHENANRDIVVRGATKHNLQNINVTIPWHKMTVVTGVSGSGKSSLVFDTLFAEGQRMFLESLSTYARRFLGRLDHGEVDGVDGLAPAISIDQKTASANPRSTVATMTEIYDYLRIIYARIGIAHCPECNQELKAYSPSTAAASVVAQFSGQNGMVLSPLCWPGAHKEFTLSSPCELRKYAKELLRQGFVRVCIKGQMQRLEELPASIPRAPIHLVIDRVSAEQSNLSRLAANFETAFGMGKGVAFFWTGENTHLPLPFCTVPGCVACDYYQEEELHPRMFSFNHYLGACPQCDGLGTVRGSSDEREVCPACQGEKLKPQYRVVTVGGMSLPAFCRLNIREAGDFLRDLRLNAQAAKIAEEAIKDIRNRLQFLYDVGLDYLSLDRRGDTLSGGEAQRIRLATQIGNRLVGVIYVLDEPTVGLHPHDTARMLATLRNLVDLGNTVVMVEHDPLCMQSADHLIDMGPGAGHAGGTVVASGTPAAVEQSPNSVTGQYLAGKWQVAIARAQGKPHDWIEIHGACLHNLKNIDVAFPLKRFCVVTGVSGSGKSSLVVEILQKALDTHFIEKEQRGESAGDTIAGSAERGFAYISGVENVRRLSVVDQTPLARSTHSNVATYCDIFTPIREVFASMAGSVTRGFTPARFSFNRPGGRCEVCQGQGVIEVEMHFLSDVWVTCEACHGKRYLEDTLAVHYRGKNIAEVLDMDVVEVRELFASRPQIVRRLQVLDDIGLGYIKLGQLTTHLSGGEAQRLKLAKELSLAGGAHTLYIMDEPTTGLHPADIQKLLDVIARLRAQGHTVILIEHNLDVIRSSDFVVDLGPEGGDRGGKLVCAGTPDEVMRCRHSYTGQSLRRSKRSRAI